MKEPTPKDFNDLFTRLAKSDWIVEGCVIDDASREHPLGIVPTPFGDYRLRDLYRLVRELGKPPPTEGEWVALFALVLAYGRKNDTPEAPPSAPHS